MYCSLPYYNSLLDCSIYYTSYIYSNHNDDAGVRCQRKCSIEFIDLYIACTSLLEVTILMILPSIL